MTPIFASLILMLIGVILMICGDHLVRKKGNLKNGGILIKIGFILFLLILSVWAGYAKRPY